MLKTMNTHAVEHTFDSDFFVTLHRKDNSCVTSSSQYTATMFSTAVSLFSTSDTAADTVVNRLSLSRAIGMVIFMSTQA